MDILGIVLRWIHLAAAISLVGGLVYQRFVLAPGLATLAGRSGEEWVETTRRRWSRLVMVCILFLLVSGLINFVLTYRFFKALPEAEQLPPAYHMIFGIKFLLGLVLFFLASVLAGRSTATRTFRENAPRWLTLSLVVAALVVAMSAALRGMHTGPNVEAVIGG